MVKAQISFSAHMAPYYFQRACELV